MDILIIDDHPLIVQAVTTVLEALAPDRKAIAVGSVEAVARLDADAAPKLVLLDLTLPGLSGLDALRAVSSRLPDSRIVIFSAIHDAPTIAQSLRSGASGFIPKTSPRSVLIHALQLVLDGGIYVPPDVLGLTLSDAAAVAETLPATAAADTHSPGSDEVEPVSAPAAGPAGASTLSCLTDRQREIVSLLAEGLTTKQISRRLCISSNTVKSHVAVIFRTLGVSNRAQAVAVTSATSRERTPSASA